MLISAGWVPFPAFFFGQKWAIRSVVSHTKSQNHRGDKKTYLLYGGRYVTRTRDPHNVDEMRYQLR